MRYALVRQSVRHMGLRVAVSQLILEKDCWASDPDWKTKKALELCSSCRWCSGNVFINTKSDYQIVVSTGVGKSDFLLCLLGQILELGFSPDTQNWLALSKIVIHINSDLYTYATTAYENGQRMFELDIPTEFPLVKNRIGDKKHITFSVCNIFCTWIHLIEPSIICNNENSFTVDALNSCSVNTSGCFFLHWSFWDYLTLGIH